MVLRLLCQNAFLTTLDNISKKSRHLIKTHKFENQSNLKSKVKSKLIKLTPPKKQSIMAPMGDSDSDVEESEEDDRMKQLLATWDDDNDDDSDDSSDDDDDDDDEEDQEQVGATKHDLNLQDNVLDHIVIAAPDFEEALKEFENMTGIKPSVVGSLRGLGTKSARVGLDKNAYIEIIAPDPKNSGPIGAALARDLEEGTLLPYHYAIRSSEVTEMKDDYVPNELGWQVSVVVDDVGWFEFLIDSSKTSHTLFLSFLLTTA